jgi:hypothetical protein
MTTVLGMLSLREHGSWRNNDASAHHYNPSTANMRCYAVLSSDKTVSTEPQHNEGHRVFITPRRSGARITLLLPADRFQMLSRLLLDDGASSGSGHQLGNKVGAGQNRMQRSSVKHSLHFA